MIQNLFYSPNVLSAVTALAAIIIMASPLAMAANAFSGEP